MLKWIGTVVSVLILGVWVWSGWYWVRIGPTVRFKQSWLGGPGIPNNCERIMVGKGMVTAMWVRWSERAEYARRIQREERRLEEIPVVWVEGLPDRPEFSWRLPSVEDSGGSQLHLYVPLWVPFMILAIPTALLWWRDRQRIPAGRCQKCGYDLTGNVSGRCPECGESL